MLALEKEVKTRHPVKNSSEKKILVGIEPRPLLIE